MRFVIRAIVLVFIGFFVGSAWGQTPVSISELLQTLRAGGYVIVVRHGGTHADQADTDPLNHDNVTKQRQLNDQGRADARTVAEAFRKAGVVSHKPNIIDAFGKDWFEIREGEASIFKPEGGGKSTLVARVQIGQWAAASK